ncbi:MAG: RdgB/HAM1 family non-canonical purine NTP pyrophosphatase [Xanthomonadales bacterium]|nr:RdgB/HAM1 family non-canonical purine NTP pyrophosphatase [Xanthomonadales bacterium]
MKREYVLASGNLGKLREIAGLLQPLGFVLRAQSDWQVPEAEETASTFVENSLIKAHHATRITGLPAIADDSGLVVPALDGAPGIYSARYAGQHADAQANTSKLLTELDKQPGLDRRAYFYCAIVLLESTDDPAPLVATARWHGRILPAPQGMGGFGYDPIFGVGDSQLSAAELDPAEKQQLSHRGQALKKLLHQLNDRDARP